MRQISRCIEYPEKQVMTGGRKTSQAVQRGRDCGAGEYIIASISRRERLCRNVDFRSTSQGSTQAFDAEDDRDAVDAIEVFDLFQRGLEFAEWTGVEQENHVHEFGIGVRRIHG